MTAIQALGKAKDRRERSNGGTTAPAELGEAGMTPLRGGLAVIARDERDRFDFVRLESAKVAVLDQIVRVFVMTLVADVRSDVVEERAVLEPLALTGAQMMAGLRGVEDLERQPRDLLGV